MERKSRTHPCRHVPAEEDPDTTVEALLHFLVSLESNDRRSVIDVDILGKIGTPEKPTTQVRRLNRGA